MPTKSKRVKIWYQSFVDPDQQVAYCRALAQALKEWRDTAWRSTFTASCPRTSNCID